MIVELQQFSRILQGGRHGMSGKQFVEEGYPAYGAGGLNGYLPEPEFDQPGIVLSAIGARCGKCFLPAASQWVSLANTQLIFPDPLRADIRFIWYQLNDEESWIRRGAGQPFIRPADVKSRTVFFPPLDEQRRIVAILDKADAIYRKREHAIALADDLLRSAYLHLVGMMHPDFLSWEPIPIESLAQNRRGSIRSGPFGSALLHSEFVDEGIAVLGIDNAVKNKFQWSERRFITPEKYEELRRYRVYPNDVIITIMGTTGRSAVVPDDIPEAITTKHLASITCDIGKVLPEFLSFAIHSDPVVIDQIRAANKGAIMDGLNLGIIRQIKIRKPPMRQQRRFADLLRKTHATIQKISTTSGDASDLFASLSQRAFRGEL